MDCCAVCGLSGRPKIFAASGEAPPGFCAGGALGALGLLLPLAAAFLLLLAPFGFACLRLFWISLCNAFSLPLKDFVKVFLPVWAYARIV